MPQKTNLNISPYYDDFDTAKNFYKVLFKPGYPIQARELSTIQSVLQNQIEQFGSHIFKDGAMVIPGGATYDPEYYSIKVDSLHLGLDITLYLDSIIENRVILRGRNSDITCSVEGYLAPSSGLVDEFTLFVKYLSAGTANTSSEFPNSEILLLESDVSYGNTTLNATDSVITLLSSNASEVGSAVHIEEGIYFIRGTFTQVAKDTLVLEPYSNSASYRVGLTVNESIISANEDASLNDNAKGFTNYAAPGADRFKIETRLAKKDIDDTEDINFIELLRIVDGRLLKVNDSHSDVYAEIKKYFAKRTYDESGDYTLENFDVEVNNSLDDGVRNTPNGLYKSGTITSQGNTPSDDLATLTVSPGTAYVKGFDVNLVGGAAVDVEKPRDKERVRSARVPFSMGSLFKVNNVIGTPFIDLGDVPNPVLNDDDNVLQLFDQRRNPSTTNAGTGSRIGTSRVYWFGLSDAPYEGASTSWDLYLFDIQIYSSLNVNTVLTTVEVPIGSRVRGITSGATGYIAEYNTNTNPLITQKTGRFLQGESLIFNEDPNVIRSLDSVDNYTIEDVKSVYQDSNNLNLQMPIDFIADTILYDKTPTGFTPVDLMRISSGSATVPGKFFTESNGFKVGNIIKFQEPGESDVTYNRISAISSDSTTLTLSATYDATGVSHGSVPAGTINVNFSVGVPKLFGYEKRGIYGELPDTDVESVDLSSSTLTITKQAFSETTNGSGTLVLATSSLLDIETGVSEVFFASYDAERYSVVYDTGAIEQLSSDQVEISNDGTQLTINGLLLNQTGVTVTTTLTKANITSKPKVYTRSRKFTVDKSKTDASSLTKSTSYGLRVEDDEISLNVSDVARVVAVYESPNDASPALPRLRFITGSNLQSSTVVGEKIVGKESKVTAQLVSKVSDTIVEIVYLSADEFLPGEQVVFQESNVTGTPVEFIPGSFVDLTDNYRLDKGHREQFSDYSRIIRTGISSPTRELLIVYDYYNVESVPSGSTGDIFTANSYSAERFTYDVPTVSETNRTRLSDTLDFRPRVAEFSGTGSPFAFTSRRFESTFNFVIAPNEDCILGYDTYLGRKDRLVIDTNGDVRVIEGLSSRRPQLPEIENDTMEIAQISYPPYLYNPSDAQVRIIDNIRYTMRDIGRINEKVSTLEEISSLSILEASAEALQVKDAFGLNRFKSGFVAINFNDNKFVNTSDPESKIDIDVFNSSLTSAVDFWSLNAQLALDANIDSNVVDLNANLTLLDKSIKKTGDLLMLDYTEVVMLNQPHATRTENINPFNVVSFVGGIKLDPPSDNWTRTVYTPDAVRIESTGAKYTQTPTTTTTPVVVTTGNRTDTYEQTTTTYKTTFEPGAPEIDYVESVKIEATTDKFMRERNVAFSANGLKPRTLHYYTLDTQTVDILPKIVEINMVSGTFQVGEEVEIIRNGKLIGYSSLQKPNHKFGGVGASATLGQGLGSSSVLEESYTIDIFDKNRPAPGTNYTATSKLLNFDVTRTASTNNYYGYATKGCKIVGKSSNAIAEISKADLISDNFGDILGSMYFKNPQASPTPGNLVTTGTKTIKLDSNPAGTVVLPGSTLQSSAIGSYSGDGTVVTKNTSIVQLRNPPRPKDKPPEVQLELVRTVYRDPLAQTFTTDGNGAYLTSFDAYFAKKDPNAKLFVELRTVELGTPTQFLVQDFAQLEINPEYINIPSNPNNPVATNFKFESPVYLQPNTEYALVFLSPASNNYEMYTARMGEKTLSTTNLPDVENVVVSKQYIGGSLFKSQNGSIWTANQFDDITFTLYKAKFAKTGTAYFYNTPVLPDGDNAATLITNPITTLPRKLTVPVSNTSTLGSILVPGTTVSETDSIVTGLIEKVGSPLTGGSISVTNGGSNYAAGSVDLYSLDGSGTGGTGTIGVTNNEITSFTIVSGGSGYVEGERLGIVTSTAPGTRGADAILTVDTLTADIGTLYLTNVDGQKFRNGATLSYFNGAVETTTVGTVASESTVSSSLYEGNVLKITQYNHANHSPNNKIKILGAAPSRESTTITQDLGLNDTVVTVASTAPFSRFEGITTSAGYALIENEVLEYSAIGEGTITIDARGVDDSTSNTHNNGTKIVPYEINGVSLTRINSEYTSVPDTLNNFTDLDHYYLEFDRGLRDNVGNLLNFTSESSVGGNSVKISQNYQFSSLNAQFNTITPGNTGIKANVRTITGRSAGGVETPFVDAGFTPITLNNTLFYTEPRLIASQINENDKLDAIPANKSLTLKLDFSTENENISPAVDIKNSIFTIGRSRLNNPIDGNYSSSPSIRKGDGNDPHASIFVSKEVLLKNPATSLKVFVTANRKQTGDFRVLYRLISAESSEMTNIYTLFPGYRNLQDTDGDGIGDRIIDSSKNSGLPDIFVGSNQGNEYSEYEFTADDLDEFTGFAIKIVFSSTNECDPISISNIRAIALS